MDIKLTDEAVRFLEEFIEVCCVDVFEDESQEQGKMDGMVIKLVECTTIQLMNKFPTYANQDFITKVADMIHEYGENGFNEYQAEKLKGRGIDKYGRPLKQESNPTNNGWSIGKSSNA